jgi:hypothetical protein
VLLRAVAVIDDRPQALPIGRAEVDGDATTHPGRLARRDYSEIRDCQDSYVGFNPIGVWSQRPNLG